jgi:hypothetical protein
MKKTILTLSLLATSAMASDQCVLQERTVSQSHVTIQERSTVRRDIVPTPSKHKKCIVDFRVRIGANWHTAFGEYVWPGDLSENEACAIAVSRAEDLVRQRVGKSNTLTERTLVCKDRTELNTLRTTQIGTVADVAQFRPDPEFPNRFWHNGAQCKWFIESTFTGKNIQAFRGIICETQPNLWVVVDKF